MSASDKGADWTLASRAARDCWVALNLDGSLTSRCHRRVRLGNSSIEMQIDSSVHGVPCFKCLHTICIFSLDTLRSVPIPDDLRERVQAYLAGPGAAQT